MGGALALDAAWLFAALLIVLVLVASGIAARRFLLERGGGTVDCGLRQPASQGAWRLGVASYRGDELRWYHLFGVLLRPEAVLRRRALAVVGRRPVTEAEAESLGPGLIVVECSVRGRDSVELAMSEGVLTGFLAWLEAAPPGSYLDQIALSRPAGSSPGPAGPGIGGGLSPRVA